MSASEQDVTDNIAEVHELIARVDHAMRLEQKGRAWEDRTNP
jgi:hypothetical protein